MPLYRLFSVFVICCALTIAGCSKSSTEAGLEKEDLDGDGIGNIYDPDIDGDGIPNAQDPDIDGDGIPNGEDPSPGTSTPNYCDRIQVLGLNEEQTTGSFIHLTWNLQTSKTGGDCVVKDDVTAALVRVRASAVGAKSTASEQTNPVINTRAKIRIPVACTGDTVEVTYDFTEIAKLIRANPKAAGWRIKQRHKADPERCDLDGDGAPDFGPAACPAEATGTYPACECLAGKGYDVSSNSCLDISGGTIGGPITYCPADSEDPTAEVPNCSCPAGQGYDFSSNACLDISEGITGGPITYCPAYSVDLTAEAPNCTCVAGFDYDALSNICKPSAPTCTKLKIAPGEDNIKITSRTPSGCKLSEEQLELDYKLTEIQYATKVGTNRYTQVQNNLNVAHELQVKLKDFPVPYGPYGPPCPVLENLVARGTSQEVVVFGLKFWAEAINSAGLTIDKAINQPSDPKNLESCAVKAGDIL